MPVYWFALFMTPAVNIAHAVLIFVVLHVLVYPASNGYNSYMDRDEGPVGGIERPLLPTRQLYHVTVAMNVVAVLLSLIISLSFAIGILVYILASQAYSYRGIRLKKYPLTGYLTVIIFQGAWVFYLVYSGSDATGTAVPWEGMVAAALLIGGFYPLTQVYQHEADRADGVRTISILLGYRGTFLFAGTIYAFAFAVLAHVIFQNFRGIYFLLLLLLMAPVMIAFTSWFMRVLKNEKEANFRNTMRMNVLASVCANLAFITLLIVKQFE